MQAQLDGLDSLVDVFVVGAAASVGNAFAGSVHTKLILPVRAPAVSGAVHASLQTLALGSSSFTVPPARAASLTLVLRTPIVYRRSDGVHDRDCVIATVQLRDAAGNNRVLRTGLSVAIKLAGVVTASCSLASAASGLVTCRLDVPTSWFSASPNKSTIAVTAKYAGDSQPVATAAVVPVDFAAAPSHSSLDSSGMTLVLPASPRFPGDNFDAKLSASLLGVSYGLRAWTVTLRAASAVFARVSHAVDLIWGDAQLTEAVDGLVTTLVVLVNSPANDVPANSLVQGVGIPVLISRLRVLSGAVAGTFLVSLGIDAMLNFGNNFIVENGAALVLDHRPGGNSSGEIQVQLPSPVGLFAYVPGGRAVVTNTAPITGDDVSVGSVTSILVSDRPHANEYETVVGACSSDSLALELSACDVRLSSAASAGGVAAVQVVSAGMAASVPLDVWYPGALALESGVAELSRLGGCSARYEWTQLWLRAGALDVTPLLAAGDLQHESGVEISFVSASAGTSRVFVRGVAPGAAQVWLAAQPSVQLTLRVSSTAVEVRGLTAQLITGMAGPNFAFSSSSPFDVSYTLEQQLNSEGDWGHVFAFATTATGATLWPLSPTELIVTPLTSSLSALQSGEEPWRAEVTMGAMRECADSLHVSWTMCPGVNVSSAAYVFLQLPTPTAVRLTTSGVVLAPAGNLATRPGIGWASSKALSVAVDFVDPTTGATSTSSFSGDGRMRLVASHVCGSAGGSTISAVSDATGCLGEASFEVRAEVEFNAPVGTLTSAPLTVILVRFGALSLQLNAHPAGPSAVTELRRVQCTEDTYQRASPRVTASLSNGQDFTVSAQSSFELSNSAPLGVTGGGASTVFFGRQPGASTITASYVTANATQILSVSDEVVAISSVSLRSDAGSTLYGLANASFGTTADLELDDGTQYRDAHALSWLPAVQILNYTSAVPTAVQVAIDGGLTLRTNHERLVGITVAVSCNVSTDDAVAVAANLKAGFRGVDLGSNAGLQFVVVAGQVSVPVLVNVASKKLTSFQIVVAFDDDKLRAISVSEGITSGSKAGALFGGPTVTLNEPTNEALLLGNKDGSVAPSGVVQLATVALRLTNGVSGMTLITARVDGLITCSVCAGSDDEDSARVGTLVLDTDAGPGYVSLAAGRRGRALARAMEALARDMPPSPPRRRRTSEEGTCCAGTFGETDGRFFGDTNGDCVFDIKDVRRASVLLLNQGAGDIPDQYPSGTALCAWQQSQLDPTQDGAFKQNDAVYLLYALVKRYRFLSNVTHSEPVAQQTTLFTLTLAVYDETSAPAATQTQVRFELVTSGAGFPLLSAASGTNDTRTTTGHQVCSPPLTPSPPVKPHSHACDCPMCRWSLQPMTARASI